MRINDQFLSDRGFSVSSHYDLDSAQRITHFFKINKDVGVMIKKEAAIYYYENYEPSFPLESQEQLRCIYKIETKGFELD